MRIFSSETDSGEKLIQKTGLLYPSIIQSVTVLTSSNVSVDRIHNHQTVLKDLSQGIDYIKFFHDISLH